MPETLAKTSSPIDVAIPFIRSVRSVFQSMLTLELETGKPFLKTTAEVAHYVSGVIGFSGAFNGNVVVSFPKAPALKLVEKFAGMAIDDSSSDFADAIGEIANIIIGAAKSALGTQTTISVPSVIIGNGYKVARLTGVPCIVIPCSCQVGEFCIEICIQGSGAAPAAN